MLYGFFSWCWFAVLATAVVITEDTIYTGTISLSVGDITIDDGVFWSIWDNAISQFTGSLTVGKDSGFYISSDGSVTLTVLLLGLINSIENKGVISFNSVGSLLAPVYNLVGLSFVNEGDVFFVSDGLVGVPIMSITSLSWKNNGFVTFHQETKSASVVSLGAPLGEIENTGDICFFNQNYHQTSTISGSGCIHAGNDSTIFLDNPLLPVNNKILMENKYAQLVATSINAVDLYVVEGFGGGNAIGIATAIFSRNYNTVTGILTIYAGPLNTLPQSFNIGLGYTSSNFEVVSRIFPGLSVPLNNAIIYNGPPPNSNTCRTCPVIPVAPKDVPVSSTSSSISSSSLLSTSVSSSVSSDSSSISSSSSESSCSDESSAFAGSSSFSAFLISVAIFAYMLV